MTEEQQKFKTWLDGRRIDELVWIKQQVLAAIELNTPLGESAPSMAHTVDGQASKYEPAFTDDDLIPFGKYKGEKMIDVPEDYLAWLWEQDCKNLSVKNYIWNSRKAINEVVDADKQILRYK